MILATQSNMPMIQSLIKEHWDFVSDDYSDINLELDIESNYVYVDENFLCLFHPLSSVMADCHIVSSNPRSYYLAKECLEVLRNETTIRSLIAQIPETNSKAIRLVNSLKFKYLGINENSFLKNGQYIDQLVFTRGLLCQ